MGKQTSCYADTITANPNRPTVTNPAHVTQYGVLELEYGLDRMWPGEGIHQTSMGGLLKFGMFCDIEFRWNTTSFLSQTDASGTHSTFGDNGLGTEIRFHRQTRRLPTMAFSYAFKIPSATTENGLGSGRVDHSFTLGASKNIGRFNIDFNFSQFLIGRPNASGFDENQLLALAFSWPIHRKIGFAEEFYGETQLNEATPGFASSLWALTYTALPRLVIDGGFEAGLTSRGAAPTCIRGSDVLHNKSLPCTTKEVEYSIRLSGGTRADTAQYGPAGCVGRDPNNPLLVPNCGERGPMAMAAETARPLRV